MKKILYISIIFIIASTLTACMERMEVDRVVFPVALGIDFIEERNRIKVYAQFASHAGQKNGDSFQQHATLNYKVIEGEGDTLRDAIADTVSKSSQNISWKHISAIIFSKSLAEKGISSELDFLCRFQEINIGSFVLLTYEDLKELLEGAPKIETSFPSPIAGVKQLSVQSSHIIAITIRELAMNYLSDGNEPILPIVSFEKEGKNEIVIDYPNTGVFKNDKLIGELDSNLTRGAVLIYGINSISRIPMPEEKNKNKEFTLSEITSTPKIVVNMVKGKPKVTIKLNINGCLSHLYTNKKIDHSLISDINKKTESFVINGVKNTILETQKLKSDIFGIGNKIYRKYPDYWLKNKKNWDEIYSTLDINIEVNANIVSTGELVNSLKYIKEEE